MLQGFIIRSHSPFFSDLLLTSNFNPGPSIYRLQFLEDGGGESLSSSFGSKNELFPFAAILSSSSQRKVYLSRIKQICIWSKFSHLQADLCDRGQT